MPDVHKRECAATGDPSQASTLSSTVFPHKKFSVRNSLYVLTMLTVVSIWDGVKDNVILLRRLCRRRDLRWNAVATSVWEMANCPRSQRSQTLWPQHGGFEELILPLQQHPQKKSHTGQKITSWKRQSMLHMQRHSSYYNYNLEEQPRLNLLEGKTRKKKKQKETEKHVVSRLSLHFHKAQLLEPPSSSGVFFSSAKSPTSLTLSCNRTNLVWKLSNPSSNIQTPKRKKNAIHFRGDQTLCHIASPPDLLPSSCNPPSSLQLWTHDCRERVENESILLKALTLALTLISGVISFGQVFKTWDLVSGRDFGTSGETLAGAFVSSESSPFRAVLCDWHSGATSSSS